ncbi:hypothetical protein ACIP2X_37365 [Streptomyces sp. NPDC089424]|uniref:hypothetical protein n=1 Tax=Streptomyces sp. NPDC089424 TaxID=3365917 RepID=UPI0038265A29
MADREEYHDESAEAKTPAEDLGAPLPAAPGEPAWRKGTYEVLGVLYYGGHIAHWAWLQVQDLVNPLVQHVS